jgi:hypothetical protein
VVDTRFENKLLNCDVQKGGWNYEKQNESD